VWFMRQAGRSLPEYRAIRAGISMADACLDTATIVDVTMQPVRRYGVDAAILFSDIVTPLAAAGFGVEIVAGRGPVVAEPIRVLADVARVPVPEAAQLAPVTDAIRELTAELGDTPLIGFAGAPFTLASYLVEGGPSRDHARTLALMRSDPDTWNALLGRLAEVAVTTLAAQVAAGASAVQLFDSWAGVLSARDYRQFVLPHTRTVLTDPRLAGVPRIHFGVGTAQLLPVLGTAAGADVVGVDWRTPLDEAATLVGPGIVLQGNLDPTLVFAPFDTIEAHVRAAVTAGGAAPGHVVNLGHGVLPATDPDVLARIVDLVHALPVPDRAVPRADDLQPASRAG
jgi:uroporphyrinogen decarboxylase